MLETISLLLGIRSFGKPSTASATGIFKITEKAPNPGGVFGTRWIRFYKDCGIHSTNNPASIGKAVSNGCIRIHNQDVNYVYSLVAIGTEVNVVSSQTTVRYYVFQGGDTLFSISQKLGVSFGKPMSVEDKTLIPVISVSIGYGGGNSSGKLTQGNTTTSQGTTNTGMDALGLGARISTDAVLIVDQGNISAISISHASGAMGQLMNKLPQMMSMGQNAQQQGQQQNQQQQGQQ